MRILGDFLSNKGILGINARNLLYIKPYNPKKAIKLADDKIKTKQFLGTRGIPVPKLYHVIRDTSELEKFDFNSLPSSFALKPNQGYGGEGIIPIIEKKEGFYFTASGKKYTIQELKDHIRDILDGRFSISNVADYAFFEQYIVADQIIGRYSYAGLPDIRVVVHNLIPVMAMLRLPTKESEGKANLHLGAVGVGIDIATGKTTFITYKNHNIEELPGGLGSIRGLTIPFWDKILTIASQVQLITNLGYMAADICLDKSSGPVLLEINARAGLGVQIANLSPLRRRLERIQGLKVTNPAKGVRIAKDLFGNMVEKEIKNISGKQIIGTEEKVELILKKGTFRLLAKIDPSHKISVLDEEIAKKSGLLEDPENYDDEKSTLKIKFTLQNKRIPTVVELEKNSADDYKMIIGQRDLKDFLIDPALIAETKQPLAKTEEEGSKKAKNVPGKSLNFHEIDQKLAQIESKIKLLYHLRPLNSEAEKDKFLKNPFYNPQFEYPELKFSPIELVYQLSKIKTDNSLLGQLFKAKKNEIAKKIRLLETMDEENFSEISIELFGQPQREEIEKCQKLVRAANKKIPSLSAEEQLFDAEYAKAEFDKIFAKYVLKWKAKIKDKLVSNCVAGKNDSLFVKADTKFSQKHIQSLVVHEIETHILTAENGKHQPYEIFNRGTANYLVTQEGLAIYNVEQQMHQSFEQNLKALSHVLAIALGLEKSFSETFRHLVSLGIAAETAFRSTLKAKRGFYDTGKKGAFTKDYIYFKGYYQVKNFMDRGGDTRDLYLGKINLEDLEKVKSIPGIQPAKILPRWL